MNGLEPSDVVDREAESQRFQELLTEAASRRVLAISDESGWGKTELLHKLRHICECDGIPVALVKLDEMTYPDEFSVAEEIARQLERAGIQLQSFEKLNGPRAFRNVAAFLNAFRSMSGEINAEGASVSGGQVAGMIVNAERVESIGAPDWTPDMEKQARLLCVDAFISDLFRPGRSDPVVILIDSLQKADQEFRRWLFRALMRKHVLGGGNSSNRCIVVLSGERLEQMLATQAINRGMRLEAIAALLGHQKMEMTLIYAKIANRVVADEYAAVSAKIDALYGQPPALPADYETTGMARLRREAHARMLGNGLCTRPAELDCRLESACETCAYFRTGTEFLPILTRQRDHARDHGQSERAALFDGLIQRAGPATTERN